MTPVVIDIKLTSDVTAGATASRALQTMTADAYGLAQAMSAMRQKSAEWSSGYAAEIEAASRADMAQFARMAQTTQTGEKAAAALNQTRTASSNAALGVLELSRAFEDAQYGMRGVLNNIPVMLMAFGVSGGLAGVVSMAAVGISLLTSSMGEAEKAASTLATKTRDAVHAAVEKAEKAEKAAEASRKAAEADAALKAEVDALEQSYQALVSAQEASAAASARQERAARQVSEALKEQALEQIRIDEMAGKISGEEAARRRGAVEMGDAAAQEKARAAAAAQKKADLDARAKAAEEEAKRLRDAAATAEQDGKPMTDQDRGKLDNEKAILEAQMKDAARRQAEANEKAGAPVPNTYQGVDAIGLVDPQAIQKQLIEGIEAKAQARKAAEAAKKEQADAAARLKEIADSQAADDERRAQALKRAEEARKLAEQREKEAATYRGQSADVAAENAAAAQSFGIRQSTRGMRTAAEEEQARREQAEKERKILEDDQAAMERARQQQDRAGERRGGLGRRVRNVVEDSGVQGRAAAALQQGIAAFESGQDDGGALAGILDRFEKMLGQLQKRTSDKGDRAKLERIMRRIDELEAQIRNDRD